MGDALSHAYRAGYEDEALLLKEGWTPKDYGSGLVSWTPPEGGGGRYVSLRRSRHTGCS